MKKKIIYLLLLLQINSKITQTTTSHNQKTNKTPKINHSSRVLNDINQQLTKILSQRSSQYETKRNLNLDPKKHVDLVLSAKDKMLQFTFHGNRLIMKDDMGTFKSSDGKIKVMAALENRFPRRDVRSNQMQCTLYLKNYGINYNGRSRQARFRVDFRSNCFKNTFTKYFLGMNFFKNPIGVKINLGFVTVYYKFKNVRTPYNFSYYFKPMYFSRRIYPLPKPYTIKGHELAHTRTAIKAIKAIKKVKKNKKKIKIKKKLQRGSSRGSANEMSHNRSQYGPDSRSSRGSANKMSHNRSQYGPDSRSSRGSSRRMVERKLRYGIGRLRGNLRGRFNSFRGNRRAPQKDWGMTYKNAKDNFDIVVDISGRAHFDYNVVKKIFNGENSGKCSRYTIRMPGESSFGLKPIGMKCKI